MCITYHSQCAPSIRKWRIQKNLRLPLVQSTMTFFPYPCWIMMISPSNLQEIPNFVPIFFNIFRTACLRPHLFLRRLRWLLLPGLDPLFQKKSWIRRRNFMPHVNLHARALFALHSRACIQCRRAIQISGGLVYCAPNKPRYKPNSTEHRNETKFLINFHRPNEHYRMQWILPSLFGGSGAQRAPMGKTAPRAVPLVLRMWRVNVNVS